MLEKDRMDHYALKLVSCESYRVEMGNFTTVGSVGRCGFRKIISS